MQVKHSKRRMRGQSTRFSSDESPGLLLRAAGTPVMARWYLKGGVCRRKDLTATVQDTSADRPDPPLRPRP